MGRIWPINQTGKNRPIPAGRVSPNWLVSQIQILRIWKATKQPMATSSNGHYATFKDFSV
jgi:hypothetical protein